MQRVAVIGNAAGGKSTLARRLAARIDLPHVELDVLLWQPGWQPTPRTTYDAEHRQQIAAKRWVIDGLGRRESIPARLQRATDIALIDLPLWMHFWLAAERQLAWAAGQLDHPPAGATAMPPTEALFRTIWEVDRDWMPEIRAMVADAEKNGKRVHRLTTIEAVDRF